MKLFTVLFVLSVGLSGSFAQPPALTKLIRLKDRIKNVFKNDPEGLVKAQKAYPSLGLAMNFRDLYNPLIYTYAYEAQTKFVSWMERLNTMYETNYKIFKNMAENNVRDVQIGGVFEPFEPIEGVISPEYIEEMNQYIDQIIKSDYEVFSVAYEMLFSEESRRELIILFKNHKNKANYEEANEVMKNFDEEFSQLRSKFNEAWKVLEEINTKADYIMEFGQLAIDAYMSKASKGWFKAPPREVTINANISAISNLYELHELLQGLESAKDDVITIIRSIIALEDEIVPKMIKLLSSN